MKLPLLFCVLLTGCCDRSNEPRPPVVVKLVVEGGVLVAEAEGHRLTHKFREGISGDLDYAKRTLLRQIRILTGRNTIVE